LQNLCLLIRCADNLAYPVYILSEVRSTDGREKNRIQTCQYPKHLGNYNDVKKAVVLREKELREVYEIQKNASSLAALIEAQQQRQAEYRQLKTRAASFPAELDESVKKAVAEVTERLRTQAKMEIELLKKEYAGERNVLSTRIEALEKALAEQSDGALPRCRSRSKRPTPMSKTLPSRPSTARRT
jgi:hypothetical protein